MIKKRKFKKMFAGGDPDDDNSGRNSATDNPYGLATTASPYNTGNLFGNTPNNMQFTPPPAASSGMNWNKVFAGAGAVAPYASNIANSFRRPGLPPTPQTVNPVVLSRIDLSNARNQISRSVRGQDLNADKALNPQAAAAVRNANLAKEIEGTSQVSEQEAFLNSRQKAEQAGMNLNVDTMNAQARNRQQEQLVERNSAIQREQSQNLSNASDKFVQQQDQTRKEQLDLSKIKVLSQMWKSSGVYDRMTKKLQDQGMSDPTGILSQMEPGTTTHAYGGRVYSSGGGAPFALGGHVPYTKGTDLEFENWFKQNTPEGLNGQDIGDTDRDYYSQFRGKAKYEDSLNPLQIAGGNPMSIRRPSTHPSYMAFGGFNPATKPFTRVQGRATGASQINPFGGGVKGAIGLGAGIPNGKFNMGKSLRMGNKFTNGGEMYLNPVDIPDMLMSNGHDTRSPGTYSMGGTMSYSSRPKAIRAMDFAGIEHMKMGGLMGHIPAGAFEEDHINGPRPTPGPDDTSIGMDILKKGGWIKKAVNPAHKGYCTPMTKSTCTPRRKAFAMTMKKHHGFHATGGWIRPLA